MEGHRRIAVLANCSLLLCLLLSFGLQASAGVKPPQLPQQYRKWLEQDVVYLINNDEKQVFLNLATDAERDQFIQRFWELRNPNPGAPSNEFREEHYRRLEYANAHYGREGATDGWRSDRGRIYITLGPPNQINRLVAQSNLWPMEIWFYANGHPALPPHFYVVFYQKEGQGEFKLYSPYMDGPQKLVSTLAENSRAQAYKMIRNVAGPEVARNSLTLLTDEPIDTQGATSSLLSDVMLSTIKNLPNHPISKEMLKQRRENLEMVSTRVILPDEFLKVFAVPLRDNEGNMNLQYLLSLNRPADFAVGRQGDRYYYNVVIEIIVNDENGKQIFSHAAPISKYLTQSEFDAVKGKLFGVEGWLPIAPGKYRLKFTLTNKANNMAFSAEKEIGVPALPAKGYAISDVIGFNAAEPAKFSYLPFTFGGVKFTPRAPEEMDLRPGEELGVFYQIWSAEGARPGNLKATYTYGRLSDRQGAQKVEDDFSREQFDPAGSMINGKKLPTVDMAPGNYRLSVAVIDPATSEKSFTSSAFRIANTGQPLRFWRVYDESMGEQMTNGTVDFQRGLLLQARNTGDEAMKFYRRALQRNPANYQARARLVDMLFARKQHGDIVALFAAAPVGKEDTEGTIVQYAESLAQTGDTTHAISTLEAALQWGATGKPVYVSLAECYRRIGNTAKANDLLKRSEQAAVAR
jgi:GWxTD domain-containing protein